MPEGTFGPAGPGNTQAPPFAVSGPTQVSVGPNRSATGSFTVSNLAGRVVRARLFVTPAGGASAEWFTVTGESERSMEVAGTATVEVALTIPADAPAGSHSFTLGAALEEAPDRVVSSPTVTFDVPPPAPKKFPWWIVIVAAVAILALALGGVAIWWFTRAPAAPKSVTPPRVQGIPEVGGQLTVRAGTWNVEDDQLLRLYTWQSCNPAEPAPGADEDCTDITVDVDGQPQVVQGDAYVVTTAEFERRLRVVETAFRLPKGTEATDDLDLSKLAFARVASAVTEPAAPQRIMVVEVPSVATLPYSAASKAIKDVNLSVTRTTVQPSTASCDPPVLDQNPTGGTKVDPASTTVTLTTNALPKNCIVAQIDIPIYYEPIKFDTKWDPVINTKIQQTQRK